MRHDTAGSLRDVSEAVVFIHESASVEEGSDIGEGTRIWHQAHIRDGATVGENSVIGKNVFVDAEARIGARCKVQNNVSVYSGVTIEDDVFVGPSVTFTNDLVPRAFNRDWQRSETIVRTGASLGANATIVCGTEIGAYAMVGAGSVVTKTVPANQLVVGNPARFRAWICQCGNVVSRETETPHSLTCEACQDGETQ